MTNMSSYKLAKELKEDGQFGDLLTTTLVLI